MVLRGLSAEALANVAGYPAELVIDGSLIMQPIRASIASGAFNRVPVLEGSTDDEGSLDIANREVSVGRPLTAGEYERSVRDAIQWWRRRPRWSPRPRKLIFLLNYCFEPYFKPSF